jgi:sulfite exporter TauE/SafE
MMEVAIQGILLGLSTGLFCLGYCAPVFVPLIMSEKRAVAHNTLVVGELALGRLIAYLLSGAVAGYLGMQLEGPSFQRLVGWAMIVLSAILLLYVATMRWPQFSLCKWAKGHYFRFPIVFGFLTGINICPPFLLAISYTFSFGSITKGILLFGGFFLGTSVYLLVLLPLGYLGQWQNLRIIALITAILSGVFFLLMGVARLIML